MDRDAAMAIKKEEGTNEIRQCRTTSPSFINRSITLMEEILQIFLRWVKDKLAIVLQIEHIDLKFNTKVSSRPPYTFSSTGCRPAQRLAGKTGVRVIITQTENKDGFGIAKETRPFLLEPTSMCVLCKQPAPRCRL
jgi:hypothetical protein